jgi:hypothetical protein
MTRSVTREKKILRGMEDRKFIFFLKALIDIDLKVVK